MLVLSHFTDEETGTQNGLKSYQRCKQWGTEKWYDPDDPALETVLNPYTIALYLQTEENMDSMYY